MPHRTQHRRWIFSFVVIALVWTIATPVLADYVGPRRTVTETVNVCHVVLLECQFVTAKSEWRYKQENSWACSNESKPWRAYSSNARPCNDTLHTNGYQYWEQDESTRTETNTYPPATINSSLQNCTLQNGWCTTPPYLSLSGTEPVAGHNIYAIEGALNGQTFACMNSTCNVSLSQGNNTFSYWALSSFGDSSMMGALTVNVDSQLPNITGTFSGTAGANGWYASPVSFNGSASDATSGLASFTCSLDGAPLGSCNTITVNSDGLHTLVLTAQDNAGHTRTVTQNTSIDTQNPSLTASISGTMGSDGWYTDARLNAAASDPSPGSGLFILEYSFDDSGWIPFPISGTLPLSDGKHTVDLRAVDHAGRIVTSSKSFWLDTIAPDVTLEPTGTMGLNQWYTASLILTASANDETSGLDVLDYSVNNGDWQPYTSPLRLSDGIHTVSVWAQDAAGLATQIDHTYRLDTRLPQIAGSLSGTPGTNGWYVSPVTLSVAGSDPAPGSGMDSLTYILNEEPEIPYSDPLLLPNGQHTVQFNARDKAGLSYYLEQNIKVDTIPPSLNVETTFRDWINKDLILSGTADDPGSGLSKIEISIDNAQTWQQLTGTDPSSWSYTWNTLNSANGVHQVSVRATDFAGLTTQHSFNVGIDNRAPEITLPESWFQWDIVTLDIWDSHSGLSTAIVEIVDPEGRWPKRVIKLKPTQFPLSFKWDRRFGDDTVAEAGTYEVKVIASDNLNNTITKNASIRVLLDILPPGPTSTSQPYIRPEPTHPPVYSVTVTPSPLVTPTSMISVFGAIEPTTSFTTTPQALSTPRATTTPSSVEDWLEAVFVPSVNQDTTTEISVLGEPRKSQSPAGTNNMVLWGTAATAAISAATAYIQEEKRRREEEQARQAELEREEEERREKVKERQLAKIEARRAQEQAWEEARIQQEALEGFQGLAARARLKNELTDWEMQEEAKWTASQAETRERSEEKKKEDEEKKKKAEELKAGLEAYYNSRKEGETSVVTPPKEKTWWDEAWDFVDEHQVEISIGIGIVAGVAVVALSGGLAAPLVAAALMGSAALAAGGSAAIMTVGLNAHYDRPLSTNLLENMARAGGAALVTSLLGFVIPAISTGVGSYCAAHQSTCARVEPFLNAWDKGEEVWLQGQLAYQTWRGDHVGAVETAMDLHAEYVDGGMPGNAVAKELREQVSDLSNNAYAIYKKYGNDVIPLLIKHGDEGVELIQKFGLDGIALLQKHGNDATDLIHLDPDVLDYVMEQGDDAVAALSRWSADELRDHGLELALRAKKDAEVLASIKKLTSSGPVDPKNLTKEQQALIEAIAANSTQYADNGQVVLGKWVDISGGFVQTAQETGSVHYNPHPDMWTMLGNLGNAKQEEVAWLIKKQVVQTGIEKGLPFEYTLNGVPNDSLTKEGDAVEAIFAGATDEEIMKILRADYMPVRMKELKELESAGYEYVFDDATSSYIIALP